MNNRYLFGSKMLKLNNPRDEDWIEFVDVPRGQMPMDRDKHQHRLGFEKRRVKSFIEGKNMPEDSYKAYYFYQLSCGFQDDENYPFNDFNILEHKQVWVEHLKNYINHPGTELIAMSADNLHKKFYHLLYQYYMITEDTHFISEEAREKVQKIHDLEVPNTYFFSLRELINGIQI